ncbi:MAG: hypothetical protein GY773_21370, partial [Actinomycetia bacterium]|nr:hypothetical protein [Actinomycetes bacterium]
MDGLKLRSDHDRAIARLAIPALGTLVAEPLYVLADTAIVGHLGTSELAGLALATTVLLSVYGLLIFLAYGTTASVARLMGAGDVEKAARVSVQALWLAAIIGLAVAAACGAGFDRAMDQTMDASGRNLLRFYSGATTRPWRGLDAGRWIGFEPDDARAIERS